MWGDIINDSDDDVGEYIEDIGQGFCPVNFFTGHGQIWTHVQDPTCPVKKFTGHKPGPKI